MSPESSDPHPSPRLPVEVCERVIDWIAVNVQEEQNSISLSSSRNREFMETLYACALTCKAWFPRARLHLQSHIIYIQCWPRAAQDLSYFKSLFAGEPTLSSSIEIIMAKASNDQPSTFHTILLTLPHLLPKLQRLQLANGPFLPAPKIVPKWRCSLLDTLRLQEVSFYSLNDLRRTISAFENLETLEISDPSWHPRSSPTDNPSQVFYHPRSAVRLNWLKIEAQRAWLLDIRSVQFVEWLGESDVLSSLKHLNLFKMMILDAKMLAAVEGAIKSAVNSTKGIQLAFGPDINFSKCK